MADLLNRKAYKAAILAKAESEGKRVIVDGKVVKGIKRVDESNFIEANRILRELIERTISQAHPVKPTVSAPLTREQIAAAGCGPRRIRK